MTTTEALLLERIKSGKLIEWPEQAVDAYTQVAVRDDVAGPVPRVRSACVMAATRSSTQRPMWFSPHGVPAVDGRVE